MDIKKPWYQSFLCCNPPTPCYCSKRHQHIYLINWEVLAWLSPPDHFDPTAPATATLPKAVFSFPAEHLPTATCFMLLRLVKSERRVHGPRFCPKCLLQASRHLPRANSFARVYLQQEQTFSFSFWSANPGSYEGHLFSREQRHKKPLPCMRNARKQYGSHLCAVAQWLCVKGLINLLFPPLLKFLGSSTCSCPSSSAPLWSFLTTFAPQKSHSEHDRPSSAKTCGLCYTQ